MNLQSDEVTTHGGPEAQEVWDFSTVGAVIEAVDPQSPWINKLQGWANVLAIAITTGQIPELTPVDMNDLIQTATHVIGIAAGSNHPLMVSRFQDYARLTLSPEGFEAVVAQQVTYDFGQILRFAAAYGDILKAEIDRCFKMVLGGEQLQPGEDFSAEWYFMIAELSVTLSYRPRPYRPRLIARINAYIAGLEAQAVLVDDDDGLALTPPATAVVDDTGGLPANLLALPHSP